MTKPEGQSNPVAELVRRAAELREDERSAARDRFLQRVEREFPEPSSRISDGSTKSAWLWYVVPLALAACVLLVWTHSEPELTLEYTVQGAESEGGYVRAPHGGLAEIEFSDRTHITVLAGARLRIDEEDVNGAKVSVERGQLQVEVTHTGSSNWRFVAGPFQLRVTGTRFALDWNVEEEQLEVVLHEGSVEIEGYAGSGTVSVQGGQRFIGDAQERTMLVSDASAVRPGDEVSDVAESFSEPQPEASSAPEPSFVVTPATASLGSRVSSARTSWSKLVAKGEFRRVVDEAVSSGTSNCFTSCSAAELNALADAARYVGRNDLAEQALLALRTHHAQTSGSRAAFLLGRLYENRGNAARAKTWYETSLREESNGAFAAEALAGKMRAVNRIDGPSSAREVAREYLRRFPQGVHSETARQLAGEH